MTDDDQAIADWLAANRPRQLPPRVAHADHLRKPRMRRRKPGAPPQDLSGAGQNTKPAPKTQDPVEQRRLRRAAERFLLKNDPVRRAENKRAKRQRQKDIRQAEKNPTLIHERMKALRLT